MGIHYRKEIKKVYYGEKKVLMMYAGDKRVWFDPPAQKDCLTLQFIEDSSAEGAVNTITGATDVFVSINEGEWQQLSSEGITFESLAGTKLYLWKRTSTSAEEGTFSLSDAQQFSASGNIASLLNFSETLPENAFKRLFKGTAIQTPPELPFIGLTKSCYAYMFEDCTALTTVPALPSTELAYGCYEGMFHDCTSIETPPALPATTLAESCYNAMFSGCTALTTAPALPAMELADYCYSGMFGRCISLTKAPALPATTLTKGCYSTMFNGCTSLTEAPELPATELAENCYSTMFSGCTSLTEAPVLPATELVLGCYDHMFNSSRVRSVKVYFSEWFEDEYQDATSMWLYGTPSDPSMGLTFYKPAALPVEYGPSRIPEGWTVVDFDPETEGESA